MMAPLARTGVGRPARQDELEREPDLEAVMNRLAEHWGERVGLRLLGPLAPYDFVVTSKLGA